MLAAMIALLLSNMYTLENYFILAFIGLLAVMHVFAPAGPPPQWWSVARLVVLAGYILFGWIMYRRVSEAAVLF
jgi:hypothetical protein